jgi:hypothetical protein
MLAGSLLTCSPLWKCIGLLVDPIQIINQRLLRYIPLRVQFPGFPGVSSIEVMQGVGSGPGKGQLVELHSGALHPTSIDTLQNVIQLEEVSYV